MIVSEGELTTDPDLAVTLTSEEGVTPGPERPRKSCLYCFLPIIHELSHRFLKLPVFCSLWNSAKEAAATRHEGLSHCLCPGKGHGAPSSHLSVTRAQMPLAPKNSSGALHSDLQVRGHLRL